MSIRTNRIKINFNIDAIKRDFIFIRLKRDYKGKWWGAEELDRLIGDEYKAMAAGYAAYAYAMFDRKTNDTYTLLQKIRNDPDFSRASAIEVEPEAVYSGNDDCICEITLARLLVYSLAASRSRFAEFHFSNLTGTLLIVPSLAENRLKDAIDVAEISLDVITGAKNECLLNVSIGTYRKKIAVLKEYKSAGGDRKLELKKALKRPEYLFHSGTSTLKRWLPSADDQKADAKQSYLKAGLPGTRTHRNFLDFGGIDKFDQSRAGILHLVLSDIQSHLSQYLTVELSTRPIDHTVELTSTLLKRPNQLQSQLDGQSVHIVDRVNTDDSQEMVKELKENLRPYFADKKLVTSGKRDKRQSLNLRVIHDAAWYEKAGKKDEYRPSTDDIQRQHLTVESVDGISNAIIKTLVKELLIKRDIGEKKLTLFDWSRLEARKLWLFAAYNEKERRIIFMEIAPDGAFEFKEIDGTSLFGYQDYQGYVDLITEARDGEWKSKMRFEGLVASDDVDINLIFQTREISLPDLTRIRAVIEEVGKDLPEDKSSGYALAKVVQEFMAGAEPRDSDKLSAFVTELQSMGNQVLSKIAFRRLLNEQLAKNSTAASQLRRYLLERHNIRLSFPKQKENLHDLFDAALNIKYFGESETEAFYLVGVRRDSVQFSFKDACSIRRIAAVDGSKLIFKRLMPTMDVDFVRTGQSTVIPFPFKYIREYEKFGSEKD